MFKLGYNIKHLTSKVLAHFLAITLTLSNFFTSYALATTIVPDRNISGNNVYIDKSANNIPVVNINDPNFAGVSHNHFTDFNLGARRAIINNSSINTVSKIGGVVAGNANLTHSANTIINEVTGTSRSQIYGPQEILGKSADYILANPNGISVNGGEFINTQSAIYTTGKVLLDSSGQLEKFLVEKGDIEIDGVDIDLSNLDYFEIIARSVRLNTAIYAKRDKMLEDSQDTELSVVTGTGEYYVKSKKLNPKHVDTGAPSLAIDTSKLGGLYAGKIRLVSSESGVGVNFPDIQSTTGDIEITADGKITHKNISSADKLKIVSTNDKIISLSGKKSIAQENTQYIAKKGIEIENGSAIASQASINLVSSDGEIKNQGIIASQGKKGVSLDAVSVKNNGIILTDPGTLGNISIDSQNSIENNGIIKTDLTLTAQFQNGFHNTGKIISKTSKYDGDNFENSENAGSITTENFRIVSESGKLLNSGLIKSKSISFSGSEFENTLGSEIHTQEKALIYLDNNFSNEGNFYSSKLEILSKSGKIANYGTIVSSDGGSFNTYLDFINTGNIATVKAPLKITSKTQRLINSGKISAPTISITTRGDIENSDTILTSLLDLTSNQGGIMNSGTIKSLGKATINLANDLSNESGLLFTTKNLVLNTGGNLLNDHESGIVSKRGILLEINGKIDNKGHIEAKKSISADIGNTLDNSGSIYSDSNIVLSSVQSFVNSVSGVIKSIGSQEITSKSAKFNNQGKIESKTNSVTLTAHDDLENSGSIIAHQNITSIGSENINNSGSILASNDMKLETSGKFINSKRANIGSGKNLTLLAEDDIDNEGEILALNGKANIKSGENIINRESGSISSELGSEVIADKEIVNNGTVISENNIDIKAKEDILNGHKGQVKSEKKVTILSETQLITNDGVIGVTSDVLLRSEKAIENNGHILSYRTTNIIGHSVINNGQINAVKSTKLLAESSIENKGLTLSGGTIEIDGKSIANLGQINSKQSTKLLAVDDIDNIDSGLIKSGGNLTIISTKGHVKNANSDPGRFSESGIVAAGKSTIKATLGFENTKAHLESGKSLEILTPNSFLNDSGNMIAGESIALRVDGDVQNLNGGAIQGLKGIDIRSFDSLSPSRSFQNKGTITAGFEGKDSLIIMGKINALTKEAIENSGIIQATSDVTLESTEDKIQNQKIILSKSGKITAKSIEGIENLGLIESNQDLTVVSEDGSIENSGAMLSDGGSIDLTAKTEVSHTKGIIKSKEGITINAETEGITVKSNIISTNSNLNLTSHDDISSTGTIQAKGDINITTTIGSFHNDSGNVLTNDGTLNIRATSVKNDSTSIQNGYLQGDKLNVTATSRNIENSGVMYSKTGGTISAKNSVINSQNMELGNGATITARDKDVINTGLILGSKSLEISATDTISNSGEINASELTLKTAKIVDNKSGAGISSSSIVTMTNTKAIKNAGLIDFGVMNATTGINSVINSGTLKGRRLSISAPTFNNTGRTELSGGASLNLTNLTSNILTAGGKSDITINGNYVNTGKLYIDGADLRITANSITNRSGAILKARSFTATAKSGGTFTNEGIIFGKSGLIVSAPIINNKSTGYLVSGTTLGLAGTKTTNYGGISSTQNMTVSGTLENRADIRTQKALSITGAVTNYGRLSGKDKVGISGNLTNSGRITSNSNVTVSGGSSIYNSGVMTSYGSMDLKSSSLTNTNVLEAAGTLSTIQSSNINNKSSIYGGTIKLKSTGGIITNEARIIARNGMEINAAGDVINKNQISLTGTGTMYITAGGDIRNDRKYQMVQVDKGKLHLYMPIAPSVQILGQEVNRGSYHDQVLETIITTRTTYRDGVITVDPQKTIISSGGNITLSAKDLNNTTGSISARRNIAISGRKLINADIVRQEHVYDQPKIQTFIKKRKWDWKGKGSWTTWGPSFKSAPSYFITNELKREPSLIQAGGTISGSLAGNVTLGSSSSGGSKSGISSPSGGGVGGSGNYSQVKAESINPGGSGASYVSKARSGARSLEVVNTKNAKFSPVTIESRQSLAELSKSRMQKQDITSGTTSGKLAKISLDDSSLSTLAGAIADTYTPPSIPKAPEISWEFDDPEIMKATHSDWTKSKSSGRYYIQETSPVFTDMGTYFSTDNFIKRIEGFEPKKHSVSSQKTERIHFGDSLKQMDFVRRQMTELTGHASLEDNVDYVQEIKNLYETGIKYGKEMKLSAGVALTEEQVNSLQDDMVWAEEIELRGTKIIVPRLYVAKSKREKRASGLLARNIDIESGSIENNGSSIVGEIVHLKSHTGDIINEGGGDIYASQHLTLDSSRDIRNVGSSIESGGTGLITAQRHIKNITKSQRYGDEKNHFTTIGKQSTIKVRGPLALLSGGDLINKGSSIESGGLQFAVGGSMINESIEDSKSSEILFSGGHHKKKP